MWLLNLVATQSASYRCYILAFKHCILRGLVHQGTCIKKEMGVPEDLYSFTS